MGLVVLIVACALHIAWIGRLALARGRSVIPWILAGLMVAGVGLRVGLYIADWAADTIDPLDAHSNVLGLLGTLAPLPLTLGGLLAVLAVLYKMPTHVPAVREWKVASAKNGDGTLVLERDAIQIKWEDRTETIARPDLRSAVPDGESVRVTWATGEVLLIPMMSPQTRQGRIRQSELLAKLIVPRDPAG